MKLKQNISNQADSTDELPEVLRNLKNGKGSFKVPNGYFDSLSPRITDRITMPERTTFMSKLAFNIRKPVAWAPALASIVVVLLFVFVVPGHQTATTATANDEWSELSMAYDPSYASEVVLTQRNTIYKALENQDINYYEPVSLNGVNLPDSEIEQYLNEHETDAENLNNY